MERKNQGEPAAFDQPEAWRRIGRRREDTFVGTSTATRKLVAQAAAAARSDLLVLVSGPPGSDLPLVARAIHAWGRRAAHAVEVLSCRAVPEPLHARELFGCGDRVYPALPGRHVGALERAAGSTLLLEDVDALRPSNRTDLWRAAGERRFRVEGSAALRPLEARLIATCRTGLEPDVAGLAHFRIELTPLAERREDLLPLAAHYLRSFTPEQGRPPVFTGDALQQLREEPWPGDVAELRERIRQAAILAGDEPVGVELLMLTRANEEVPSFKEAKRSFEAQYVRGLLKRCQGNISRAARLARKDRKDFYDVIRRTGVDPSAFRG